MKVFFLFLTFFSFHLSYAQPVFQQGDWKVFKNINTTLNKIGCVAETREAITVGGVSTNWVLQVVRLQSPNGDYSFPFVLSYPESHSNNGYFEAVAQSDKDGAPEFNMTILQPDLGDRSIVASRKKDRLMILRHLKAGETFNVDFLNKDGVLQSVPFSLTGSSKSIKRMAKICP